jgi:hypothetical protein
MSKKEQTSDNKEQGNSSLGGVSDFLPLDLHDRIKLSVQMEQWENRRGKIHSVNQLEAMLFEINMKICKKQ